MTKEELAAFIELALAVHELASPERRRRISRALDEMQGADIRRQHEFDQNMARKLGIANLEDLK